MKGPHDRATASCVFLLVSGDSQAKVWPTGSVRILELGYSNKSLNKYFISIIKITYVCSGVCAHECRAQWMLEAVRSLGARLTSSYECLDVGIGNQIYVL